MGVARGAGYSRADMQCQRTSIMDLTLLRQSGHKMAITTCRCFFGCKAADDVEDEAGVAAHVMHKNLAALKARASLRQRWAFSAHAQRSGVGRIDSLAKRPETQVIRRNALDRHRCWLHVLLPRGGRRV